MDTDDVGVACEVTRAYDYAINVPMAAKYSTPSWDFNQTAIVFSKTFISNSQ